MLYELATLRRRRTPPLIGFVCLPESCQQQRCHACRFSANPLCRYPSFRRSVADSTLGPPRRCLPPILPERGYPLSGFGSLSECHPYITASARPCIARFGTLAPSEVFCPSASCQSRGATYTRRAPPLAGYVAPPGFRTLSTLCSPRDLPSLFHPGPALGLRPSRLSSPRCAVRPLERRFPHGFRSTPFGRELPLRVWARRADPNRGPGV